MLGEEHYGFFILFRILPDQIFHGFDQEPLSLDVSGIIVFRPFSAATTRWIRH